MAPPYKSYHSLKPSMLQVQVQQQGRLSTSYMVIDCCIQSGKNFCIYYGQPCKLDMKILLDVTEATASADLIRWPLNETEPEDFHL